MTPGQMEAYLKAWDEVPDQTVAAFLRMALAKGMRKGALVGLRWDDIDLNSDSLPGGEPLLKKETERIPLSQPRVSFCRYLKTGSEFIFPGKDGPRKEFKKIAQRAKKRPGYPKTFDHYMACAIPCKLDGFLR